MQNLAQSDTQKQPYWAEAGRVLLVVNAKSRQGQENFDLVKKELQKQGIQPVVAQAITNPQRLRHLVEKALEQEKIDSVLVGSGDGTISALADLLAHRKLRLGVIPLGTANDFARNLSIPTDISEAVKIIKAGYIRPIDLGCAGERYFLNVASIGLGTRVALKMNSNLKKWLGPLAYAIAAAQALIELRPFRVRLIFDDQPSEAGTKEKQFEALQIAIANGRYYGGGLVSAPDETIVDKTLSVTVIQRMGIFELLRLLPGLRSGKYIEHSKVHHYKTTGLQVETAHAHRVNLDGEVCQRTPLGFKVIPSALEVFAPEPGS